jgi:redox-sensitive bicupin YhaK (pirin superfamily)
LNAEGDAIDLNAETETLLLFGHAAPIGEPVVSHGPFVMNTREQIAEAINDYQAGRFGAPI